MKANPTNSAILLNDAVNNVAGAFVGAWSNFHLLQGIHRGAVAHDIVVQEYGRLLDEVWRSIFHALVVTVGTIVDPQSGTESLPNLVGLVRTHSKNDLSGLLDRADQTLKRRSGLWGKLVKWRHQLVAHRTPSGKTDIFYQENKMHLPEIETALKELEALFNQISVAAIGVHVLPRDASLDLMIQGESLLEAVAETLARDLGEQKHSE